MAPTDANFDIRKSGPSLFMLLSIGLLVCVCFLTVVNVQQNSRITELEETVKHLNMLLNSEQQRIER